MTMYFSQKAVLLPLLAAALLALPGGAAFADEAKKPTAADEAKKSAPAEAAKTSPGDVLAKVNGTSITRGEVDRAMKVLLAQNPARQPMTAEMTKQAQEATLNQLITAELLYQAGTKKEIKDLDKQVQDRISQSKAKFPSAAEFEKALATNDLTEKDLAVITRKDIVITKLVETEIVTKVTVPEADAKKFYDENKDKFFKQEAGVRASHILISVDPKAKPEEKKAAKEKAEAIRKRIVAGEDFATLAKSESGCPSSKQGGDLGFFSKGQMVEPFEKAAFALKPGELSDVVETQFGYHIIKVTEKKEAGSVPFEEVKDKIQTYLKNQKIQKAVADYSDELKKKATIELTK
jgi:peptidyl-prolyl cis-trans isomerase C